MKGNVTLVSSDPSSDPFFSVKTIWVTTIFIVLLFVFGRRKSDKDFAGRKTTKQQEATLGPVGDPELIRLNEQNEFLKHLHTNDLLPGVSKDMPGWFLADPGIYNTPEGGYTQEVVVS